MSTSGRRRVCRGRQMGERRVEVLRRNYVAWLQRLKASAERFRDLRRQSGSRIVRWRSNYKGEVAPEEVTFAPVEANACGMLHGDTGNTRSEVYGAEGYKCDAKHEMRFKSAFVIATRTELVE
eukprot:5245301-Amphidinium_carterae.2